MLIYSYAAFAADIQQVSKHCPCEGITMQSAVQRDDMDSDVFWTACAYQVTACCCVPWHMCHHICVPACCLMRCILNLKVWFGLYQQNMMHSRHKSLCCLKQHVAAHVSSNETMAQYADIAWNCLKEKQFDCTWLGDCEHCHKGECLPRNRCSLSFYTRK